ncbi:hypothetical protein GQ53DRAFT_202206 [Thozetella sp. PMI_491]|nr:hypothetical protein GQ53DRAFT_202206 [Thozetella sp. PMI_491]
MIGPPCFRLPVNCLPALARLEAPVTSLDPQTLPPWGGGSYRRWLGPAESRCSCSISGRRRLCIFFPSAQPHPSPSIEAIARIPVSGEKAPLQTESAILFPRRCAAGQSQLESSGTTPDIAVHAASHGAVPPDPWRCWSDRSPIDPTSGLSCPRDGVEATRSAVHRDTAAQPTDLRSHSSVARGSRSRGGVQRNFPRYVARRRISKQRVGSAFAG